MFSPTLSKDSCVYHVYSPQKLPNPVFSRLLKEVKRRDEIIRRHLNQYKVWRLQKSYYWRSGTTNCIDAMSSVQSQDRQNDNTIMGSLLGGLDKQHSAEQEVVSARRWMTAHSDDKTLNTPFSSSPVPDWCSRTHGHCGPSHRGHGDDCSLAELDRGFSSTQARGGSRPFHEKADTTTSNLNANTVFPCFSLFFLFL